MRDKVIAGVLVLVAVAVVGAAFLAVTNRETRDPQAEAEAAIDAFLAAVEQGDTEGLRRAVADPSSDVADSHAQMLEALGPTAVRVERDEVVLQGSQADVDLTYQLDLLDADTVSWQSHLIAQRIDGSWQVRWEPTTLHPELGPSDTFDLVEEPAGRAEIRAFDGTPLTAPGELVTVGIEPRRVEDEQALLADVAMLLPEGRGELEELLAREDLRPTWFYPVVTIRGDRWVQVETDLIALPGISARTEAARLGSDDGFALHVLGRVGAADEEEAAAAGVQPGVEIGRYGLEAVYEDELTGTPAFDVVIRDADGDIDHTVGHYQGDPPAPIVTTLSEPVQRAAENALVGVEDPAAIVVLDHATGAIRATASRPLAGFNRAWAGRYPPGSTFKVATALAALREADLQPSSTVECPAEVTLGGRTLRNAGGFSLGTTTLEEAFARSCNSTHAMLAADVGAEALARAAEDLGFGASLDHLPLDAFGGSFPEPADTAELAAAAIGQARVEASPLMMASVAAAIADGAWRPPFLVGDDPTTTPAPLADATAGEPLNAIVAGDLRTMMEAVVARGSGTAAAVDGDPPVAGKTGSAEFGSGDPTPTHAWFIGFRGPYAFAVLVEGGGGGGDVAAPLAGRLLRELAALTD